MSEIKPKGISTSLVAVAVIVALIIGAVIGYFAKPTPPAEVKTETVIKTETKTIEKTVTKTVVGKPFEGITITVLTTAPCVTAELDKEFEYLTGAKVEVTTVAWPDLHPKLVTALASKSPHPDVFVMPDEWVYEFGKAGWLLPVDEYLTPEEKADLLPIAVEMYSYEGHLTSFVFLIMPHIMFYNEKILSDAGFRPATTWDEFVAQCKTLQEKGVVTYGITWPLLSGDDISFECWASQFLSRGGTFFDEKGEPIFNNEIGVEALQFLIDSIYTLKIASPTSVEVEKMACLHPFMAGENAYNWNWQFMYPITKDPSTSKIVEYSKYCLIPSKPGAKYTGFIAGGAYSINPYSKNKEVAIAYAKFITSKENSLKLLKEKGWLPWWGSVYEMPEAKEIEPQLPIILEQLKKSFARGWFRISWYAEFAETIRLEISKAWLKEKTAKEALDSAVSAIKEKLKEYGR